MTLKEAKAIIRNVLYYDGNPNKEELQAFSLLGMLADDCEKYMIEAVHARKALIDITQMPGATGEVMILNAFKIANKALEDKQ